MPLLIKILTIGHAFLGGLGLLAGIINLFSQKGGSVHHKAGKVFTVSMIGSALPALFITMMPGHKNLLLFLISIITIYLVLAGNRALTFKNKSKTQASILDKIISGTMLVGSVVMITIGGYRLWVGLHNSLLFLIFGSVGLLLTVRDFQLFKSYKTSPKAWLINHIGRIVGALIASVTAFIIAGLNFQSLVAWLSPTLVGLLYIIFWNWKLQRKSPGIDKN